MKESPFGTFCLSLKKINVLIFSVILLFAIDAQSQLIYLWPGGSPGFEDWEQQERVMLFPGTKVSLVQNVKRPSILSFR